MMIDLLKQIYRLQKFFLSNNFFGKYTFYKILEIYLCFVGINFDCCVWCLAASWSQDGRVLAMNRTLPVSQC